jgi:5-methylcytosine-specific restriction protein A
MRREFPKQVKRDALKRAAGKCEGKDCNFPTGVKFHFDHDIADGLGGEPTLENCKVLCHACHADKTRKHDVPLIAKVKRISDKHNGIRKPSRLQSAGFRKSAPQRTASRPIERRT